ncbi:acyltransferase [Rhodococcus triatomae]|uniref:Condensation domain-containing protein n=1 Tax=Rhodococcus triatomae TaxID=300028 RepID=A0A1G8FEC8_9NOCA|nr:condensation domain-containing protein [Rhodococcus triatomae]QNG19463.1 acyltransferase [Rhodococcus triatomae]QNG24623.1 acyltransferase [Rhodococcus triatomae]SDH80534.1 Condensation domain-containing protein [Rhodococcus triatomae]
MDLNLITHWEPRPGRVVEWKVSDADARSAAQAPIDPAPPTTMQERHLRRAQLAANNNEAQSPWIGIAFDFPGKLDADAMARTLRRYVERHDTLHSWFSFADPAADPTDKSNAIRRHVVAPEHFTLTVVDGPEMSTPEQVREYVGARFANETSALGWPAFVFGAIEHAVAPEDADSGFPDTAEGFTLFHAVDHAHTDMQSMILMFAEIRIAYQAEIDGTTPELPDPGSYVEYSGRERERAAALTLESPEVQGWLGYLARTGGSFPGFPLDLGVADGPAPAIGSRFDLADECEQFGAVCKAHGSNFIGGVFAALAITEHELAGRDRYLALSPLTTRGETNFWSQGWFINLVPVAVELDGAETFTDLAATAQKAYRDGKTLGDVSVQQVIETVLAQAPAVAAAAPTALTPPPILSYIDGRRLPQTESYVTTRATGLVGGKDTQIASIWVNRVLEGTWMAISHPDTETAHASVAAYAGRVSEIMRTVAREGDYHIGSAG